jgi:hypothetical protein
MKLINEKAIYEEWAPQIEEKTGVTDKGKLGWLTKYCHFHALNESSFVPQWSWPAASLQNTPGMGNVRTGAVAGGANQFFTGSTGSGDKFPSLLPLSIQVGARTVGFEIVPVIPMNGPSGVLTYLDYVYTGGKAPVDPTDANAENPTVIKVNITGTYTVGQMYQITDGASPLGIMEVIYIGKSRVDGYKIFRILKPRERYRQFFSSPGVEDPTHAWVTSASTGVLVADVFGATATGWTIEQNGSPSTVDVTNSNPSLVKALEDHIQGYAGSGPNDDQPWFGNFMNALMHPEPMRRGVGEQTYFRTMGLQTFTKFVEAETYQVAATVTTEQISDLSRQFGIDVVGMIENSLTNEISQHINKHILSRAFALGWSNHDEFYNVEGQTLNMSALDDGLGDSDFTAVGKTGATVLIPVPQFVNYTLTGAYENQWTIQRRVASKILAAGNVVSQRGRRGPANFIVTNLQLATVLQDSAQFTFAPMANTINQSNGSLYPVGAIAGMTVYVDPNMEWSDTRVLVGRKGADEEPGLKFMPYLMAESIQTIAEGTMSPKVAVKSRYALVEAGFHPQTMYFTFFIDTKGMSIV